MKTKTLAILLCLLTGISVLIAVYFNAPHWADLKVIPLANQNANNHQQNNDQHNHQLQNSPPHIELIFALDTTGSMGGLIQAAKEKIWSIASTMATTRPAPLIKMGIVAYRDRGDEYITKTIALSENLDQVYAQLLDLTANGGGDSEESVNAALAEAIDGIHWSQSANCYKAIFLVGDAPGHNDYADDTPYQQLLKIAQNRGIVVNTIQAGDDPATRAAWRQIAALGGGATFQVDQQGSAVAITTPFDQSIAEASQQLDNSRLYFGNPLEKNDAKRQQDSRSKIYRESTSSSLARRAKFNQSASAELQANEDNDLVLSITGSRVKLSDIKSEELPQVMQSMTARQREIFIKQKIVERASLKQKLKQLSEQREQYIAEQLENKSDLSQSLDAQLISTLTRQAAAKGILYQKDNISY